MKIFIMLLTLCISAGAQTWTKIATEGATLTASSSHTYKFGTSACWSSNFIATFNNFVATNVNLLETYRVPDPCPQILKEIDAAQEATAYTIIVNGTTVTVPAKPIVNPPKPPSVTLNLTISPIPVVINGTIKYSCTSAVLDATGTLNLTCNTATSNLAWPPPMYCVKDQCELINNYMMWSNGINISSNTNVSKYSQQ